MKLLVEILLAACFGAIAAGAKTPENRAEVLFDWFASDRFFESLPTVLEDGTIIPDIQKGRTARHPDLKKDHSRYYWELEGQGMLIAGCGQAAIVPSLRALNHQDFYVRVIAVYALDILLGTRFINRVWSETNYIRADGKWIGNPMDAALIQEYRKRAELVYPPGSKVPRSTQSGAKSKRHNKVAVGQEADRRPCPQEGSSLSRPRTLALGQK